MWKKVPKRIDYPDKWEWVLFDRVSGLKWEDIEDEALMFDFMDESEQEEFMVCENCGERHPGAILPEELMDELYDDF
jgi:hypothetical protein